MEKVPFAPSRPLLVLAMGLLAALGSAQANGRAVMAADAGLDWPGWSQRAQALAHQAAAQAAQQIWPPAGGRDTAAAQAPRIEAQAGQPDPRLQLAPCAEVDVYLPAGHRPWGSTRVGVRCLSGSVRWNVSLPVHVKVWAPAWRTRTSLPAGTQLNSDHLERAVTDWSAADTLPFADEKALLGRTLVRSTAAQHALRDIDLKRRQWFAVGDTIKVVARGQGYSVTADATALTPGLEGQPARARTEAGRVVNGIATAERRLELPL
ncbi:MAG: flagellar basal body P-ring formation chaperone FlgA [Rubrivivax sp.]